MRLRSTMVVWKIMAIGLAICASIYGLGARPLPQRAIDAPLRAARARWLAQRPERYRLVVQEDSDERSCRQEVTVHDERVEAVLRDDCAHAEGWTVSDLLDWAADRSLPSPTSAAVAMLGGCSLQHSVSAVYDPKLGYPYTLQYQQNLAPNYGYLRLWQGLLGDSIRPSCAKAADGNDARLTLRVVSIDALP